MFYIQFYQFLRIYLRLWSRNIQFLDVMHALMALYVQNVSWIYLFYPCIFSGKTTCLLLFLYLNNVMYDVCALLAQRKMFMLCMWYEMQIISLRTHRGIYIKYILLFVILFCFVFVLTQKWLMWIVVLLH